MHKYTTAEGRINKFKGELLAYAIHVECLGITGTNKKHPKNVGDTQIFRRWVPWGATLDDHNTLNRPQANPNDHVLQEGVTPEADVLVPQDISVVLQQYGALYAVTDKTVDLYEDDVPAAMKKQTGERLGLVREMIRYGSLKAGTNAYYAGGTSRSTVSKAATLGLLRKIARNLMANHTKMITSILAPSPNYATAPVEAGWLVFHHSDLNADVREIPGFKHVSEYGTRKPVHPNEIGSVDEFRFVWSPELAPYPAAGAAIASTGLIGDDNVDVYPMIVVGEDAWGQVALRGVDSVDPTWIPPGQKDKNDPLGQRGYVGANFWMACVILNQGWMAVAEVGASDLEDDD